jgi:hypothetical protein
MTLDTGIELMFRVAELAEETEQDPDPHLSRVDGAAKPGADPGSNDPARQQCHVCR